MEFLEAPAFTRYLPKYFPGLEDSGKFAGPTPGAARVGEEDYG